MAAQEQVKRACAAFAGYLPFRCNLNSRYIHDRSDSPPRMRLAVGPPLFSSTALGKLGESCGNNQRNSSRKRSVLVMVSQQLTSCDGTG